MTDTNTDQTGTDQTDPGPDAAATAAVETAARQAAALAKAEAETAIAALLGCTPAEAKARLDATAAAEEAAMTEVDRIRKQAQDTLAAAEATKTAAEERAHEVSVSAALAKAGGPQIAAKLVDVPVGSDTAVIEAAIADLKKQLPAMFAPDPPAATDSDPGGQNNQGSKLETPKQKARRMFEQRHPAYAKNSAA